MCTLGPKLGAVDAAAATGALAITAGGASATASAGRNARTMRARISNLLQPTQQPHLPSCQTREVAPLLHHNVTFPSSARSPGRRGARTLRAPARRKRIMRIEMAQQQQPQAVLV